MTTLAGHRAAAVGVVKRDWAVFRSYRTRFVSQIVSNILAIALFYYLSRIVGTRAFDSPDAYFAFAVVGLVVMEILIATMATLPLNLRQELVAGTLERLVLSPFGLVPAVVAMTVFPFVLAFAQGIVMLAIASLVFGMPIAWQTAPLAIPIALLGALSFLPFSLLIAGSVILVKQAGVGAGFIVTAISLVGGFLFPVALLPAWIEWMSEVQPFTPALDLLRHLLVDTPLAGSAWTTVAKLIGFAALLLPLSLLTLHRFIRLAQRRGTIIEY
jgi:ABC-2 type transport system permease protein